MNVAMWRNFGAWLQAAVALPAISIVAGGAGDGVAQVGPVLDRRTLGPSVYSGVLLVGVTTTGVSGGDTVAITVLLEDSADGTNFDTYQEITGVAQTYDADVSEALKFNVNLSGARRYFRVSVTADFAAASVDAAGVSATWIWGPGTEVPGYTETPFT